MQRLVVGALACALVVGCGTSTSRAYTSTPPAAADHYVGSVFTYCTQFESDSGKPGVNLRQRDVVLGAGRVGACPSYLVLPELGGDPSRGRRVHYLSSFDATKCVYANPELGTANTTQCWLADAPPASSGPPATPPPAQTPLIM